MYLGGVFVCINPLALRALPLYFAAQNTGGECECPVALRGVALAIGEVSRSDGGIENAIVSVCLYRIYSFLP